MAFVVTEPARGSVEGGVRAIIPAVAEHEVVELTGRSPFRPCTFRAVALLCFFLPATFDFALPAFAAGFAPLGLLRMGASPPVPAPGRCNRRRGAFISGQRR